MNDQVMIEIQELADRIMENTNLTEEQSWIQAENEILLYKTSSHKISDTDKLQGGGHN